MLLRVTNVRFRYLGTEDMCLDGIGLNMDVGQITALMGRNGAGKTTLLRIIRGLAPNFYPGDIGGHVYLNGCDIDELGETDVARKIGYVSQNPFTQITGATSTVHEEIAFGLENLGWGRTQVRERTETVIDEYQLGDLADRHPMQLSGGQAQRVAIAAGVAMQPELMLLDEPTSQLDPRGARRVIEAIERLRDSGMSVLLVEQNSSLVLETADSLAVLDGGRVACAGDPLHLFMHCSLDRYGLIVPQAVQLGQRLVQQYGASLHDCTPGELLKAVQHL